MDGGTGGHRAGHDGGRAGRPAGGLQHQHQAEHRGQCGGRADAEPLRLDSGRLTGPPKDQAGLATEFPEVPDRTMAWLGHWLSTSLDPADGTSSPHRPVNRSRADYRRSAGNRQSSPRRREGMTAMSPGVNPVARSARSLDGPVKRPESRSRPPFRADHVGSLLRPQKLLQARQDRAAGAITAEALRAVEDEAIR